jgi:hypothetical protein
MPFPEDTNKILLFALETAQHCDIKLPIKAETTQVSTAEAVFRSRNESGGTNHGHDAQRSGGGSQSPEKTGG